MAKHLPFPVLLAAIALLPRVRGLAVEPIEVVPFLLWPQTWPPASLEAPVPQFAEGGARTPAVLRALREDAGLVPDFLPRPIAGEGDVAKLESQFGTELRAAEKSAGAEDDLALAARFQETAAALEPESGLRRLFLLRALVLAAGAPAAEEAAVEKVAAATGDTLETGVPADLVARALVAERLLGRAERLRAGEERVRPLRESLIDARLDLARFQLRHGYLDEARDTLSRAAREAGGAPPGKAVKILRDLVEARQPLRERLLKHLREAEAREGGAGRFTDLAFFCLAWLRNEPLGAAAARRSGHAGLVAYGRAGLLGAGRSEEGQAEKLVDLIPHAPAADRKGLAELALDKIAGLLEGAEGKEAEKLKALRNHAEELLTHREGGTGGGPRVVEAAVSARRAWSASGAYLRRGRRYRITAVGKWSPGGEGEPIEVDAAGDVTTLLEKIPLGSLVAQVGAEMKTIAVGRDLTFAAPADGELYLSMHDRFRDFPDNSGKLEVRIEALGGGGGFGERRLPSLDLVGRWSGFEQKGRNVRELRLDGTCVTGGTEGTWVAKSPREAVLRWENGALERLSVTAPGARATLFGNSGRSSSLVKE